MTSNALSQFDKMSKNAPAEIKPVQSDVISDFFARHLEEDSDFRDAIEAAAGIGQTDLSSPDAELKIMYAVVRMYVETTQKTSKALAELSSSILNGAYEGEIDEEDKTDRFYKKVALVEKLVRDNKKSLSNLNSLANLARQIVSIKESKARIESAIKLDAKVVTEFVANVFSIIQTMLPANKSQEVLTEVFEKVIKPGVFEGDIEGTIDEKDFEILNE